MRYFYADTFYFDDIEKNVDFIKIQSGETSSIIYMINYKCFEKLVMNSDSPKSEEVRIHFIKLKDFLVKNFSKEITMLVELKKLN